MDKQYFTYVPPQYAKEGFCFVQVELPATCSNCPYSSKCRLEPGRVYRVVEVRGGHPSCRLLHTNLVGVVVEDAPIEVCLDAQHAVVGSSAVFMPVNCENVACPYYVNCTPVGIRAREPYTVLEVVGPVQCPKGLKLFLAKVRRTSR